MRLASLPLTAAVSLCLPCAVTLSQSAAPQSDRPGLSHTYPLRNTFVVATEALIDTASSVLSGDQVASAAQMQQLQTMKANLVTLAEDERENEIAVESGDLVFLATACQLQARSGADLTTCRKQFEAAKLRLMDAIGKRKRDGVWIAAPHETEAPR